MFETLINIDKEFFLLINGAHNEVFDCIMWWTSKPLTWLPLYILMVYLIIKKYKQKGIYIVLMAALLIALSDLSSVHLFKNVFHRLRPSHNPDFENVIHLVNNKHGGLYGFVSSHAANYFAVATYIFLFLRKPYKYFSIGLFLWAALISYSRIYLGLHYPADVFVGAVLGVVCGIITYYIYLWVDKKHLQNSKSYT